MNYAIFLAIFTQSLVAKANRMAGAIAGYVITAGIFLWGIGIYADGGTIAFLTFKEGRKNLMTRKIDHTRQLMHLLCILLCSMLLLSCGILGSSEEDECLCAEIEYQYDETGIQSIKRFGSIECDDQLIALSKEGGPRIRWTLENGRLIRSEAINCGGTDEPQIVNAHLVRFKGLFWHLDCPDGVAGYRQESSITQGGIKTTACFEVTCARGSIPLTNGGSIRSNYLQSVKLCN